MAKSAADLRATGPGWVTGPPPTWPARLELRFEPSGGRTAVHRRHFGPLLVQRPFYPEPDGTCHSYILHPPGGVAAGDSLRIQVSVESGARCVLTAPGATKFYRTPFGQGVQSTTIEVAASAVCENLPLESILFDGGSARTETDVRLAGNAVYFGWDLVSLGRPACGERFSRGRFEQRLDIRRDGRRIWFERTAIDGGSDVLDAAYGFAGEQIFGTAIYAGELPPDAAQRVVRDTSPPPFGRSAVTQLDGVLVCRFCGPKASAGRAFFAAVWDVLRRMGQGKPAAKPRIWAT